MGILSQTSLKSSKRPQSASAKTGTSQEEKEGEIPGEMDAALKRIMVQKEFDSDAE